MKNFCRPTVLLLAISAAGCTSPGMEPLTETVEPPSNGIVLSRSSLSGQMMRDPQTLQKMCLGRGADTAYEHSEAGGLSVSLVSSGSSDSEASEFQDNAGEEELAGRTPAVLMTREIFYRACEFSTNYKLTKSEATQIFHAALKTVDNGWSNESKNTTVTVGDTVATSNSNEQNSETTAMNMPDAAPTNGDSADDYSDDDDSSDDIVTDSEDDDDGF